MTKKPIEISDKLYELAFEYKKLKLWNKLSDVQLFAVKLSDGAVGYISVLGKNTILHGLNLFIGEDGFASFRSMVDAKKWSMYPWDYQEQLFQQKSYQCIYVDKECLSEKELDGVRLYAREHDIKLRGKLAYPQFLKYSPNHFPWEIQDKKGQDILCEALSATIALAKLLENEKPNSLGLESYNKNIESIIMLEQKDDKHELKTTKLPKAAPIKYPEPIASNDILIASLKRESKCGVWECGLIRYPKPVKSRFEEVPIFPIVLLAVEAGTDYILPIAPFELYEENSEELLNLFIKAFIREKVCPVEIRAQDMRTYSFVKSMCDRLKIKLSIEKNLPTLCAVEHDFWTSFEDNEMPDWEESIDMLSFLLDVAKENPNKLPIEVLEQLAKLMEEEDLPDEVRTQIIDIFNIIDAQEEENKNVSKITSINNVRLTESYVIKVSYSTDCYRYIQISSDNTLLDLHDKIQEAFEFNNDHLYAFFMDNKIWSKKDCYYADGMEYEDCDTVGEYSLKNVGVHKGKQFKYLFDFGNEWVFQCRVMKVIDEKTEYPIIIKSVGDAPSQYGDWEDE